LARLRVRVGERRRPVERQRQERDQAGVGAEEPQLPRLGAGQRAYDQPYDLGAVRADLAPLGGGAERLPGRLDARDLGDGRPDRRLELLRHLVRLVERQGARELDVQRKLLAAVDVDERDVVHLANRGNRDRRRVRALAQIAHVDRLDVDYDV